MGHANLENISLAVNHELRKIYGTEPPGVTISEIITVLREKGQAVHASEGQYTEDFMLSHAVEQVIEYLRVNDAVEAIELTPAQRPILEQWIAGEIEEWDCGDDGNGGEYAIFDSIQWRARRRQLPVLTHVTN